MTIGQELKHHLDNGLYRMKINGKHIFLPLSEMANVDLFDEYVLLVKSYKKMAFDTNFKDYYKPALEALVKHMNNTFHTENKRPSKYNVNAMDTVKELGVFVDRADGYFRYCQFQYVTEDQAEKLLYRIYHHIILWDCKAKIAKRNVRLPKKKRDELANKIKSEGNCFIEALNYVKPKKLITA